MDNPGLWSLGDAQITSAVTDSVLTEGIASDGTPQAFLDNLDGMLAATIEVDFAGGTGGTSTRLMIDTRLDGVNWIEVGRFLFTNTSALMILNLSGLTPRTTPLAPVALSDNTAIDGVFGNEWRARRTSVGTYTNTSIAVRLVAR